jgi:enamine deaminase RidA (YjgF/YER057c/UK114 family)
MSVDARLQELGIELPEPVTPSGSYIRYYQSGSQLFVSGTGPSDDQPSGKLGADLTVEQGYQVARNVGLQILATVQQALGSLDQVKHVVKVLGMVNSAPDFDNQPGVINGCSDLFVEVLGDAGRHTRSAVGFVALPHNIPVEIEATFEVK